MVTHLSECAMGLHAIHSATGREIHIGLEPEPDCILETTDEVIRFYTGPLLTQGVPYLVARLSCSTQEAEAILRRHIGVCFDTCHLALQFESLSDSLTRLMDHGIRLSKIQLSAALEINPTQAGRLALRPFLDPVYLHQVKGNRNNISFPDLADALCSPATPLEDSNVWRVHFHLPLYHQGNTEYRSTTATMDEPFWKTVWTAPVSHWEIETYTFHVLPPALQSQGLDFSIAQEYEWVRNRTCR